MIFRFICLQNTSQRPAASCCPISLDFDQIWNQTSIFTRGGLNQKVGYASLILLKISPDPPTHQNPRNFLQIPEISYRDPRIAVISFLFIINLSLINPSLSPYFFEPISSSLTMSGTTPPPSPQEETHQGGCRWRRRSDLRRDTGLLLALRSISNGDIQPFRFLNYSINGL